MQESEVSLALKERQAMTRSVVRGRGRRLAEDDLRNVLIAELHDTEWASHRRRSKAKKSCSSISVAACDSFFSSPTKSSIESCPALAACPTHRLGLRL